MQINFGPPPPVKQEITTRPKSSSRSPDLNIRVKYKSKLGFLLRESADLAILKMDGDQTISYVFLTEIEKI